MAMLKDFRFIAMIVLVLSAAGLLSLPMLVNVSNVTVETVLPESRCEFSEGDVINQIFTTTVKDAETYDRALRNVKQGDRVTMVINGAPFGCDASGDKSLGITISENAPEGLNFGIDIEGGTRVVLRPAEDITRQELLDTVTTLENRINFFGLREVKVNTLGNNLIQIEMSGSTGDDIREFLAKQGEFEGKISFEVGLVGGNGILRLDEDRYDVSLNGDSVTVDGIEYDFNDTISLEGQTFEVVSASNSSILLYADLMTGEDVVNILTDSQNSAIVPIGGDLYEFRFGVQVTKEVAERFAELTRNQPIVRTGFGDSYIEPRMILILDDVVISELNIVSNLAGQEIQTATITGTETSFEEATIEKLRLESTLRSGSLPVKLEIEKVDTITQTAGQEMVNSTIFVALAAVIAVGGIVSYRYRDYQIVIPIVIVSLLEIVIVLGMASNQMFAGAVIAVAFIIGIMKREVMGWMGWITLFVMVGVASTVAISPWTIDIPVIAGLIAILGAGANQMIIMTDQLFKEKDKPLKERHKTAMSIIWSSAATIVFAMLPLMFGGIGALKGFAIATVIGILVGLLITRPAYISIIEQIKQVKLEPEREKEEKN